MGLFEINWSSELHEQNKRPSVSILKVHCFFITIGRLFFILAGTTSKSIKGPGFDKHILGELAQLLRATSQAKWNPDVY